MSETTETWLSEEAHERLTSEYERLTTIGRAEISKEIEEARSHGDLKENAEYHAAKEEQGKMEARIRQLKQLLDNAEIGTPPVDEGVTPGLLVEVEMFDEVDTYLVGSREDDHPDHEVLSAESPIGQSIMGARVGDIRTATLPNGSKIDVTVRAISAP